MSVHQDLAETKIKLAAERERAHDLANRCQVAEFRVGMLEATAKEAAENPCGDYYLGLHCGIEDRDITDRYDAVDYGWECAFEYVGCILLPLLSKGEQNGG